MPDADAFLAFVPGDSEKKLAKVAGCGADVVIVDLEDAVAPQAKARARSLAREWLVTQQRAGARFQCWVRINALDTGLWREDVDTVIGGAPAGLMVPKAGGPAQLQILAAELHDREQRHGLAPGSTRLLPLVSETPAAALRIPAYLDAAIPRLAGLTWGAEDLSAALGASRKRDANGRWTDPFRMVRAQVLLAAHACGIMAVDTLHADFRDLDGLERVARESHADGFAGMLAIHPDQVAVINAAFVPSEAEIAEARRIVEAFAAAPNSGRCSWKDECSTSRTSSRARRLLASLA